MLLSGFGLDKTKREKIHVKEEKKFIETYVLVSKKIFHVKNNLTYYWYKSRTIQKTKGGYSGSLLDGKFDKFNNSKQLIEQGYFRKGLKHKKWKTWYESGELKSICNFRKGLKHGKEILYDKDGLIISEISFFKGNQKN